MFAVRFACPLDKSERFICLTLLTVESSCDDNKKVLDKFISFLESLGQVAAVLQSRECLT
jgi:hypothetical protein